ncbi:cytoskeleton-associated protein 2-like isoform X1 [Osmerus mordax]|uniref:cytoskeleton-associated protein 2-like isoform X1 n=1 Tax=Osmerus mordax TaxID=8014 RepID=UPI00350F9E6E
MDQGETVSKPDRKELRKQKLMEYLAAKGKLKPINPKPYLRDVAHVKKSSTSVVTVYTYTGKENQGPNALKVKKEGGKVPPLSGKAGSQATSVPRRSTTQKATITNNNNKQEANKATRTQTFTTASLTARINALKSITQSVGPRRPADQKQAPNGKKTTAVIRPHTQAASQPRAQLNQSVAVLAHPSQEQPLAKVKSKKSHLTSGMQPSTLLSACTRPSTANSTRMSIGTVAKTKTGLNPTVIQPRNTNPQASGSVPNASTSTRVPSRAHSDSSSSAAISQEASVMQRKALPVRAVDQSVDGKERPSHVFRRTESRSVTARPPQLGWRPPVTASRTTQRTTVRPNTAPGKPGGRVQPNTAPEKPGGRVHPNPAPEKPGGRVHPNPAPEKPGGRVHPNPAPEKPGWRVRPNTAPEKPGGRLRPNTAPGRPGGRVLETRSTRPPILPVQKTKRVLHLGVRVPAEAGSTASKKPARPVSTGSNQWQATALSRAMQAAVAERVQKDSVPSADRQNAGSETARSKAIPCKRDTAAGARGPVMPQTVPRAARPASQGWWPGGVKTPVGQGRAAPQTEGKKNMTAAQEDRMRRLQEWREARGISYKRPPMPVKPRTRRTTGPPQPYWACMEQEEETQALVHAVDRSLDDCITLLLEGCPVSQVQGVLSRLPAVAQKFAKFWICQARLMEREGRLDVLPMFEEAVRVVLEPVDELRAVVFDILKKKDDVQAPPPERDVEDAGTPGQELSPSKSSVDPISTPKPVRALIHGDQGSSSVVKYKITATPGGFRSQQREPARVNGHELRFFTPVRRSVRIERSSLRYPAALQDHDLCVTSYQDLVVKEEKERMGEGEEGEGDGSSPQMTPTVYVYRENDALRDQVHMQLVYEED